MLEGRRDERLLVIVDQAGAGKSALLRRFAERCRYRRPAPVPVSLVSLSEFLPSSAVDVLAAVRRDLGLAGLAFDEFDRCTEASLPKATPPLTPDPQGSHARGSPGLCLDAFIMDLRRATSSGPVAILIDDADRASPEMQEAVERLLRGSGPSQLPHLVLVLAGRAVPFAIPGSWPEARVEGLSAWSEASIKEYAKAAMGRELRSADLELLKQLVDRGVPLATIVSTVTSLTV